MYNKLVNNILSFWVIETSIRISIDLQIKSAHSGYQDQAMWILSIFYIKVSALIISSISNPSIYIVAT